MSSDQAVPDDAVAQAPALLGDEQQTHADEGARSRSGWRPRSVLLRRRTRRLPSLPRALVLALCFTAVSRLIVFLRFTRHVALSGDEKNYWRGAQHVLDIVQVSDGSARDALNGLLDRGWFMPGVSILLAPVRAFTDDPSAARLWIGIVNYVLFALIVYLVAHRFGVTAGWCYWTFGTFMPLMVLFSFSLWGETLASSLTVLITYAACVEAGRAFGWRSSWRWLLIGAGLAALIYIRPNMILLSPVIVIAIILTNMDGSGWRRLLGQIWRPVVVVGVATLLLVLPWSVLLSAHKDGLYLTTTSIELGQIVGFGDPDDVDEVAQGGNPWFAWDNHIQATAEREGIAYAEALTRERKSVMSSVTIEEYLQRSRGHFDVMLFAPNGFIDRFFNVYEGPTDRGSVNALGPRDLVGTVQVLFWAVLLIVATIDLLVFGPTAKDRLWEHVILKLAMMTMLVQPLLYPASARYHMALLAIVGVIASTRLFGKSTRWPWVRDDRPYGHGLAISPGDSPSTSLVEVGLAAVVIGVVALLLGA